jgi:hypothetical protein
MYHFHAGDRSGVLEPVIMFSEWGTSCWKQYVQTAIRSQASSTGTVCAKGSALRPRLFLGCRDQSRGYNWFLLFLNIILLFNGIIFLYCDRC